MTEVTTQIDAKNAVAYLTIPERIEFPRTIKELTKTIDTVGDDNAVKSIVIRRLGPNFWTEADEATCAGCHKLTMVKNLLWGPLSLMGSLADCKRVVVAQVQGQCLGIGLAMALVADITIAEDTSKFSLILSKNGVSLPDSVYLIRCIGTARAKAWAFEGRPWTAREAEDYGLINSAVPAKKIDAVVKEVVDDVRRLPLDGVYVGKTHFEAVLNGMGAPVGFALAMNANSTSLV